MMYQTATHAPGQQSPGGAGLEDYLKAVKAHRLLIVVITVVAVALALWFDGTRIDQYEATARVVVGPSPVGSTNNQLRAPILEREQELLRSDATAAGVIERLGLAATPSSLLADVGVAFVPASEVMRVSVTREDPAEAAAIANAFAQVYTEHREAAAVQVYEQQLAPAQQRADEARQRVDNVREQLANASSDAEQGNLRADLNSALNASNQAEAMLSEARAALSGRQSSAAVLQSAGVPSRPVGVGRSMLVAAGLVLGLAAGVVTAFLRYRLDTTARDESRTGLALGTDVLTSVPVLPLNARSGPAALIMISPARSKQANRAREAYRRLRSSLSFLAVSRQPRQAGGFVVTVTSALPAEGKSVTSANLAIALAQSGSRVVLVNADLRNPTLERFFQLPETRAGLSGHLAGDSELAPIPVREVPGLALVPAGGKADNPTELLAGEAFAVLIKGLRDEADYVVVDCPPVLIASDPSVVARHTDGVIVVVDSRTTDTDELLQVRADLDRTGSSIIGAVLNRDRRRAGTRWRLRNRYAS